MRNAVKDTVRAAWHGPATAARVAVSSHLSERQVQRFWEAEKKAGRLPDLARPHFSKFSSAPTLAGDWSDSDAHDADEARDVAPCGLNRRSHQSNVAACDASLAALIAAHGSDPWINVAHTMPAHTLQMEAQGFPPSASRLRQFNKVRDIVMRTLMKRRDARRAKEAS